jgi:ABC-type transport system substrate-binding protein
MTLRIPIARRTFPALLALLVVAACGKRDPFPGEKGMVLHQVMTANVKGFDTTQVGDVYSHRAQALVYEELLQYKYLERPFQVEPCLAEAMPEVSEDGLTYTFRIRKGVFFHDDVCFDPDHGTPKTRELVASDFVYSFKRIADAKNTSTGWWLLDGKILGLNAFRDRSGAAEKTDYDIEVEGLQAPDARTFVIRLTEPYPQLLYVLTMTYLAAVSREAVEYYKEEILNHPVGTGPYRLTEWIRNYRLVFDRNPRFGEGARPATGGVRDDPRRQYPIRGEAGDEEAGLLADAGKVLPLCDRVIFYEITGEGDPPGDLSLTGRGVHGVQHGGPRGGGRGHAGAEGEEPEPAAGHEPGLRRGAPDRSAAQRPGHRGHGADSAGAGGVRSRLRESVADHRL